MVDIAGRKSDDKVAPIQPFPTNADFKPPRVLDEEAREMIWKRVFMDEEPVKVVSAELGVDIRRVAAVVRMKTIEKEWQAEVCLVMSQAHCVPMPISSTVTETFLS